MGLEKHSLDAHKKFIKQCVDKVRVDINVYGVWCSAIIRKRRTFVQLMFLLYEPGSCTILEFPSAIVRKRRTHLCN